MFDRKLLIVSVSCMLGFAIPSISWGCEKSDISIHDSAIRNSNTSEAILSRSGVSKQNCITTSRGTSCVMSATGGAVNQNYSGSNNSQVIQVAIGSNSYDSNTQNTFIKKNVD